MSRLLAPQRVLAEGRERDQAARDAGASTKEAPIIYDLWNWAWLAAMITGVVVWGLIIYAVIRYCRRSETEIPVQTRYNLPIEIFYTIAPVMMVIVFFYFTVDTQDKVLHADEQPRPERHGRGAAVVVDVQLRQGRRRVTAARASTRAAPPPTADALAGQGPERHLHPRTRPTSIHSFWVPASCSRWTSSPAGTTILDDADRVGTFVGRCAELCGVHHSRMLFNVKVVERGRVRRPPRRPPEAWQHRPGLGWVPGQRTARTHVRGRRCGRSRQHPDRLAGFLSLLDGVEPEAEGSRALDFGCGTGSFAHDLRLRGYDVTGIDPSPAMIARARAAYGEAVDFRVGDASLLGEQPPFALITSIMALQFVAEIEAVVGELASALDPGGHLVFAVHNSTSVQGTVLHFSAGVDVPIFVQSAGEYHALARSAGLAPVVEAEPPFTAEFVTRYPGYVGQPPEYLILGYEKP